jgi:exonuclease III
MKLATWNCNGALRNKLDAVFELDADISVIQECEDPARSTSEEYKAWAGNYLWRGENKNRGIGIFAKPHVKLKLATLDSGQLESFLPCWIDDSVLLLAVWTRQANSPTFQYIGQLWQYIRAHRTTLASNTTVVIGDLNSNVRWDKWDRWWNHSDVVRELEDIGLQSAYHHCHSQAQGAESNPTFYLQRKIEKAYHIDYIFVPSTWLAESVVEIGKAERWLATSDHMPLSLRVEIPE